MRNSYRPEIDGLRALAVLPVILFHAGIEIFKGGFAGVDVFFVVSGYLITSIIIRDIRAKKFSLTNFYERRARRILPALIVTIFLCLPFSLILLPPSDLKIFSKSIISSLTFWSNFQFSSEAGYFAIPGELKPLLHTWSLSIEEQFYIFFPILCIILFKLGKKFLIIGILLISILSLLFGQWSGNFNLKYPFFDKEFSFYSYSYWSSFMMPFGRIWELGLGSLCALIISNSNFFRNIDNKNYKITLFNIFSIFGIILVLFSFFYLSSNTFYPSFFTLIPAFGTCLIILFCQKKVILQKILSYKILVFLGLISYSAYLFHYPIFSFIKFININVTEIFYISLVPFILYLSYLNWKHIEIKFRRKDLKIKTFLIYLISSYLIIIFLSIWIFSSNGLEKRKKFFLPESILKSFQANENGKNCFDINYVHENIDKICKIGDKNKKNIDFIVFGDSHILSFFEMFDNFGKDKNKLGLFVGYSGCPPILNVYNMRKDQKIRNCFKLNQSISKLVERENIKNIILISRWSYYTGSDSFERKLNLITLKPKTSSNKEKSRYAFEKGLKQTLNFYKKINTKVFLFEEVPLQTFDPEKTYYRSFNKNINEFKRKLENYSVSFEDYKKQQKYIKRIFNKEKKLQENLKIIETGKFLCNLEKYKCFIGNEKFSFYVDDNHLSTKGANIISKKLLEKIILIN
tara:strand:+ start:20983 stop:23049 length:2067 start_codon:yes stop_codon:yes gene_type:complete